MWVCEFLMKVKLYIFFASEFHRIIRVAGVVGCCHYNRLTTRNLQLKNILQCMSM